VVFYKVLFSIPTSYNMMIQYHDGQHNPQVGNTDEIAFDKAVDLIFFLVPYLLALLVTFYNHD